MRLDPFVYRAAELQSLDGGLVCLSPIADYTKTLEDLPTYSITYNGRCVGGAVLRGQNFHIAVLPEFRGLVGRQIIKAMNWGLSIQEPFIAKISTNNAEALRLIKFFGNNLVSQDATTLTYLITQRGN